jgi:hypothetical protein
MANNEDKAALKITLEDLAKVSLPQQGQLPSSGSAASGAARQYGNISAPATDPAVAHEGKSNVFLQGWFYLGAAGLLGALAGWAICEPGFLDSPAEHRWGNTWIMPVVLALMCFGFGIAESLVERSFRKALLRGSLALLVGAVSGFVFDYVANFVFRIALYICFEMGVTTQTNPAAWVARGLGWMVFGVAGGIVYGLIDRSSKKMRYGILGGMIGAGVGGMIFDPIGMATNTAGLSRAVGFGLFGLATGVAMGIVESALKDRWFYVASGPLAGKQFILYKPVTVIGSSQQCDIYLFKDTTIQPQHASIELRGGQTFLHAIGQVFVSGQPARTRSLTSGDRVQIGRYSFDFRERHR